MSEYYDEIYGSFEEWAASRRPADPNDLQPDPVMEQEYISSAKQPTIPFTPLTREIGISVDPNTEVKVLDSESVKNIALWVGRVKKSFDLVQRAEGTETPAGVYFAAGPRATRNMEQGTNPTRALSSKASRAAIHRFYETTEDHLGVASERLISGQTAAEKLRDGIPLEDDDKSVILEILQELANGLAANLDNSFSTDDKEARVTGNSILALAEKIEQGSVSPRDHRRLIYAGVAYVRAQGELWKSQLSKIDDFAKGKRFTVGEKTA